MINEDITSPEENTGYEDHLSSYSHKDAGEARMITFDRVGSVTTPSGDYDSIEGGKCVIETRNPSWRLWAFLIGSKSFSIVDLARKGGSGLQLSHSTNTFFGSSSLGGFTVLYGTDGSSSTIDFSYKENKLRIGSNLIGGNKKVVIYLETI